MLTRVVDLRYSLVRKEDNREVTGNFAVMITGMDLQHLKMLAIEEFFRHQPPTHRIAVTVARVRENDPITVRGA